MPESSLLAGLGRCREAYRFLRSGRSTRTQFFNQQPRGPGAASSIRPQQQGHTSLLATLTAAASQAARLAAGTQAGSCILGDGANTTERHNRWQCELCWDWLPPLTGVRHHCRICNRTVCDGCSFGSRGDRRCTECSIQASKRDEPPPVIEKYIFLVRHAQSTWNQNVDMAKTFRHMDFAAKGVAWKDVVSLAANAVTDVMQKDHPISEKGVQQTTELRKKIATMKQEDLAAHSHDAPGESRRGGPSGSSNESCPACSRSERERRYYERFLMHRGEIYCSPLLRALQTAHLALPVEDGWGSIKLLKDAREQFRLRVERDCVGVGCGTQIVDRAMSMGQEINRMDLTLPGLDTRVDASDCLEKWWSDTLETEADVDVRLKALWKTLLEEDKNTDSCVLVTHSNLIKAILMHFGCVDEVESEQDPIPPRNLQPDGNSEVSEIGPDPWQVVATSPESLRPLKVQRLQNCGVLGLHCVLESPAQRPYKEVDGFVDLAQTAPPEPRWVARDALLMFDSVLVE